MSARHGLVIGKFYPPHAGHHQLVRTAAGESNRVTVVVMASSVESIPLELRVAWLRDVHAGDSNVSIAGIMDEHRVDFDDAQLWDAHVRLMREAVERVTPEPVDTVFTSESYGDELARRFGARHVCVDLEREMSPVSGTAIRANPVGHWHQLAPPVQAWLARRVVVIGAESTGKSTIAIEIASALRARGGAYVETRCVEEYGRDYAALKPATREWHTSDFVNIARTQNEREDRAAGEGGPVLICDTDSFATSVWHERYMGARSSEVERIASARSAPLYLLTHSDDVPFTQDGTRDGEKIRDWMTARFESRLSEARHPFVWLRGDRKQRHEQALAAIDTMIAAGWNLAPPLA